VPNIIKTTHCLAGMSIKDHFKINNVVTGGPKTSKWPARGGGRSPCPPVSFATDRRVARLAISWPLSKNLAIFNCAGREKNKCFSRTCHESVFVLKCSYPFIHMWT